MRAILAIGLKDLRQRLRDRSALVVAFVAPIALASIISVTFGGSGSFDLDATFVVVDHDRSALSAAFADQVLGGEELRDQVTVVTAGSASDARAAIRREEADGGFVIDEGFQRAVREGRPLTLTVLRSPGAPVAAQLAEGIANGFLEQVRAGRLSVATALGAGGGDVVALSASAAQQRLPVRLTMRSVGEQEVGGANYFGPSMAVFFLFFTVGWGARSVLVERRQGTLDRVLAAPVSPAAVLAGKGLTVFVLGVMSMATMFAVMGVVFGVGWGDPLAVGVLTVITVLAVMAVTTAVATLAKTDEQADSYASMVAISLALIGGNFFPVHQMPDALQTLSLATPNGWAIRGYTDLVYDGGGLGSIGTNVAMIAAFTVVTGLAASWTARRMVMR